ncbi:MAG: SAM-dependent methyltransferase, partial [Thermomicrobiales bacterium]
PVPGPSSLAAAMSISGFPHGPVCFLGFLSRKTSEREAQLRQALGSNAATYLFESPHRIKRLLQQMASIDPQREIVVCRELTKMHEEVLRGQVSEIQRELESRETIRGEFVLGVAPSVPGPDVAAESLEAMLERELSVGGSLSSVAKRVSASTGASRSDVYALARSLKERQATD